jgi:hypothetical protein
MPPKRSKGSLYSKNSSDGRPKWIELKYSTLDKKIDDILAKTQIEEVQSRIARNIWFRYNSINVVIGQRGSGKTHFVLREALKLLEYPNANYSTFLYSSNKASDDTVEKFAPLFAGSPLNIQQITHNETHEFIKRLEVDKKDYNDYRKEAKEPPVKDHVSRASDFIDYDYKTLSYENFKYAPVKTPTNVPTPIKRKPGRPRKIPQPAVSLPKLIKDQPMQTSAQKKEEEYDVDSNIETRNQANKLIARYNNPEPVLTEEQRVEKIVENMPLNIANSNKSKDYIDMMLRLNVIDLKNNTPHTLIFIDDCIDLLTKRGDLFKDLFQNRQSRITYFLGLQDVQGIPPSMKSNMDSLVLFGGFPKMKFDHLFYQIAMDDDYDYVYYSQYRDLHKNERMMLSFEADGVKKYTVRSP